MIAAIILTFAAALPAADLPVAPGTQPVNLGRIGAGEGPAWSPGGSLFFTGEGHIHRRTEDGKVQIFRAAPNGANGLLFDPQGRLIACESGNRRITRTEKDGTITVLADAFQGKPFNSPNDLTIDSKGRIYFSDPRYGKRDGMEILDAAGRAVEGVYRIDAPGKVTRVLTREIERPNGVLVSPNDEFLYVADNNNNNHGGARKLYRFRLLANGSVDPASRKLVFDWRTGRGPDGLKMDTEGRLFVAAGRNQPTQHETSGEFKGGVYILSPEGKQLQFIAIPVDEVTNCAFGGPDRKTLFITAGGTLWSIPVTTAGRAPAGP
ncbi:MAG: SMP-30/gluconolactonase/LRE family protein [Acidobacteria bacterium]|nr:SMP-30/gluconolactonase/LRE family protein [Acidobacteriota bacterium]